MQFAIEITDEVQTVSNETNMVRDYASGLHYSIVENGGFLRNGLGLSHQQWVHLTTLERANLVSSRMMGSVEYMRTVRQRYGAHDMDKQMIQMQQWMMAMTIKVTTILLQFPFQKPRILKG